MIDNAGKIYAPESGRISTKETRGSPLVCSAILVTLLGPAEAAGRGIAARAFMGLLPLLLRDRLDGYEFLFLQSRIDAGQIFRRKLLEIVDHVFQFVIESVCAGDLLIGRPAFV